MKLLRIAPVAGLVAGALALSACGSDYAATTPTGAQRPSQEQADDGQGGAAAGEVTGVKVTEKAGWSPFLSTADGKSIYRFDGDTNQPPASNCKADCAKAWAPVPAGVAVEGVDKSLVGEVAREDGKKQLTIKGWSAYTFSGDQEAGQVNGNGKMGKWFLMAPDGKKAKETGDAAGGEAVADGGTFLTDKKLDGYDTTVLVDERGMTLYRFDEDQPNAEQGACEEGECAEKWPAATGPVEVDTDCVNPKLVTELPMKNGKKQIAVNGWRLYYFFQDKAPGDVKGDGVGGTWFVSTADGKKANPNAQDPSAGGGESSGGGDTGGGDGY